MTDRPIIFSGPMVRALLDGRKTQTRRLATSPLRRCEVGDRLYVREAHGVASIFTDVVEMRYQASESRGHTEFVEQIPVALAVGAKITWPKYRPSIHMPRWASRLTLIVTDVRVEPLQAISEADAQAEGMAFDPVKQWHVPGVDHPNKDFPWLSRPSAREMYAALWDVLHGSGEWLDNPDALALTFRVERGNIDRMGA